MTDYTDIQRVISRLKKHVIPDPIINNDAFDRALSILYEKYKHNNYYESKPRHPILFKYLRNNFVFYCKHYPRLVATVAALGVNEPDYWLPDLKSLQTNAPIVWNDLNIHTIANAEAIFQIARKKVRDIVTNTDKPKYRIDNVLKDIKPLAGAEPYNDIRRIYWMLYCELRVTLQFLKPDPSWKFFFTIGDHPEHWFKLRGEKDVPALKYLSEHSIEEYEDKPDVFRDGLLSAVRGDCVSEPKPDPVSSQRIDEDESNYIFRQVGDVWEIKFEKEYGMINHTKGLKYLHKLLCSPNNGIMSYYMVDASAKQIKASLRIDNSMEIPEVSDSDSGEVSDTIPINFRTLVLVS